MSHIECSFSMVMKEEKWKATARCEFGIKGDFLDQRTLSTLNLNGKESVEKGEVEDTEKLKDHLGLGFCQMKVGRE